jgi:hypothetical protein
VSVAETITITQTQDVTAQYAGTCNESLTVSSAQSVLADFIAAQIEVISLADVQSVSASFLGSVSELQTLTTSQSALAAYVASISESLTLTDTAYARGWIQINNAETANWTLIDSGGTVNSGTNAIAELPFGASSGGAGTTGSQWRIINTTQDDTWVLINSNQ